MEKHLIITGSSSGIGSALKELYLSEGWKVTGIDKSVGKQGSKKNLTEIELDLTSNQDISKLEEMIHSGAIERADALVLNAGISCAGPFIDSNMEDQLKVIDLNLTSTIALSSLALRSSLLKSGGTIAFVSSMSRFLSYPGASVYAATKDGVTSWANSVRKSFKESGITVLTIFPGPTRTPHAERYSPRNSKPDSRMEPEKLASMIKKSVANKRSFLIPGMGNKLVSFLGVWLPPLGEQLMKKLVFQPLKEQQRA